MKILYTDDKRTLRQSVLHLLEDRKRERSFILVPDRRKLEVERWILDQRAGKILFRTEIMSFSRFAYRMAGELGNIPKKALSPQLTTLLFHQLLEEAEVPYQAFGPMMREPSFLPELAKQVQEFRRYQFRPDQLRQLSAELEDEDPALSQQAREFAKLLEKYIEVLETRGFVDQVDHLQSLEKDLERGLEPCEDWSEAETFRLKRLDFLKTTQIFVAGFGELEALTLQEAKILTLLDKYVSELIITLQMPDLPRSTERGPEDHVYFSAAWTTYDRLRNAKAKLEAIPLPRTKVPLAYTLRSKDWSGEEKNVTYHFHRFPNLTDEIRYVLGDLRAKKVAQNLNYRDFAIAVLDPSWLPSLRRLTKIYDIPVYFDQPVLLRESLPVGLLNLLIQVIEEGYRLEDVTRYLRHPLLALEPEQVDRFENFCLARGIDGYRFEHRWRYLADWTSKFREGEEGELSPYYDFQLKLLKPVRDFHARVRQGTSRLERLWAIKRYLEDIELEESVHHLSEILPQSEAIGLVKSWNNLLQWIEDLALWTGKTREPLETFFSAFMLGLEAGEMETIPSGTDQVLIADARTCSQGQFEVLYILGATMTLYPGSRLEFPLFKQVARERLEKITQQALPNPELEDQHQGASILFNTLTQCADEVCLSHHEGKDSDAMVIQTLEQTIDGFVAKQVTPWPNPALRDPRLGDFATAENIFLALPSRYLGSPQENKAWRNLLKTMSNMDESLAQNLEASLAKAKSNAEPNRTRDISQDLVEQRLGMRPVFSASQLERYAACPFVYYMDYLLRLQEREIWSPQVTHLGSLMHGLLEYSYADLIEKLKTTDHPKELLADWYQQDPGLLIHKAYEQLLNWDPRMRLFEEPENKVSITRMALRRSKQTLEDIRLMPNDFFPKSVEWRFGFQEVNTPYFNAPKPYGLKGLIDRIDVSIDDTDVLAIRDYKSSGQRFVPWEFLAGLDLQLPIYALVLETYLRKQGDDEHVKSAGWIDLSLEPTELKPEEQMPTDQTWHFLRQKAAEDKLQTIEATLKHPDWSKILAQTKKATDYWVEQICEGHMPAQPILENTKKAHCEYCDHRAACGFADPQVVARDYRDAKSRAKHELHKLLEEVEA